MRTYKNLYEKIISLDNLSLAWMKARKRKTKKEYVIEFEKNLLKNLTKLHNELNFQTYKPKPLETFILKDPKTRKISKSDFRDRIIHHALIKILEPIFDKTFIYDSYANRKGKGTLKALQRFDFFKRKVSNNGEVIKNEFNDSNYVKGYCLKADIKHYFDEVDHEVLIEIIKNKIRDEQVTQIIQIVLDNHKTKIKGKGMPLGNLTSQFLANVYLNELDYFVKHKLKAKYYIRYVDDFVILHKDKNILEKFRLEINKFLKEELKIELHPEKSRITSLSRGIDFVGFKNFYHFKLLRKRNIYKMYSKINLYSRNEITFNKLNEIFQGWQAHAKWANTYKIREDIKKLIKLTKPNFFSQQPQFFPIYQLLTASLL